MTDYDLCTVLLGFACAALITGALAWLADTITKRKNDERES